MTSYKAALLVLACVAVFSFPFQAEIEHAMEQKSEGAKEHAWREQKIGEG